MSTDIVMLTRHLALALCSVSHEYGHCTRCENRDEIAPACSELGYCEGCYMTMGEAQDERAAEEA